MTSFGKFIKSERESHNWTQTDFGAKIGINSSAISRIENGTKILSSSKIKVISQIIEIDIKILRDLYFADKFAREAFKNHCSNNVFTAAKETLDYIENKNAKQAELIF